MRRRCGRASGVGGRGIEGASRGIALLCAVALGLGAWSAPGEARAQERTLLQPGNRLKAQAEAGIQFFPGGANAILGTGVTYGVLVSWQPLWFAGLEIGYEGANYDTIDPDGEKVSLFENGAQLVWKVSPNFGVVEPYALGGIGFSILSHEGDGDPRRDVLEDNTMVKVPLGLGVDFHLSSRRRAAVPHVILGVRGVYRVVFNHPFRDVSDRGADQITLTGLVGIQL